MHFGRRNQQSTNEWSTEALGVLVHELQGLWAGLASRNVHGILVLIVRARETF